MQRAAKFHTTSSATLTKPQFLSQCALLLTTGRPSVPVFNHVGQAVANLVLKSARTSDPRPFSVFYAKFWALFQL